MTPTEGNLEPGNKVILNAWNNGMLRQDTVPRGIFESRVELGSQLKAQVDTLESTFVSAQKELQEWVKYFQMLKKKYDDAMDIYGQQSEIQVRKMEEYDETIRKLQQEVDDANESVELMEREVEAVERDVAQSRDESHCSTTKPPHSQISSGRDSRKRGGDVMDLDLDLDEAYEATRKELERLKHELEMKRREQAILEDDLQALDGLSQILEAREKQFEIEAATLCHRKEAINAARLIFEKEKIRRCQELHLASPEDVELGIARLQSLLDE